MILHLTMATEELGSMDYWCAGLPASESIGSDLGLDEDPQGTTRMEGLHA